MAFAVCEQVSASFRRVYDRKVTFALGASGRRIIIAAVTAHITVRPRLTFVVLIQVVAFKRLFTFAASFAAIIAAAVIQLHGGLWCHDRGNDRQIGQACSARNAVQLFVGNLVRKPSCKVVFHNVLLYLPDNSQ